MKDGQQDLLLPVLLLFSLFVSLFVSRFLSRFLVCFPTAVPEARQGPVRVFQDCLEGLQEKAEEVTSLILAILFRLDPEGELQALAGILQQLAEELMRLVPGAEAFRLIGSTGHAGSEVLIVQDHPGLIQDETIAESLPEGVHQQIIEGEPPMEECLQVGIPGFGQLLPEGCPGV